MLMRFFSRKGKTQELDPNEFITVVSGLPRSGTSMMMKMLEAGGLPVLTDNIRSPDENNPKGYLELERVKKLKDGDKAWMEDAQGKAVKVISALLEHLPPQHVYKVVFMEREMKEILASQERMLLQRGEPTGKVSDEQMAELYRKHLAATKDWLIQQKNMHVIYISYNEMLRNPAPHASQVNHFLGGLLDQEAMVGVIDKNLYRQRAAGLERER